MSTALVAGALGFGMIAASAGIAAEIHLSGVARHVCGWEREASKGCSWHPDFEASGPERERITVMVNDGKEECGRQVVTTGRVVADLGLKLRLNVVGFALADEKTKSDMRATAGASGGNFVDAQDPESLLAGREWSLRSQELAFVDNGVSMVANGTIDSQPVAVPVGRYLVSVLSLPHPLEVADFDVKLDQSKILEVNR